MDNYFLEKPHLKASFNGLVYNFNQNDILGYIVVVSNEIKEFCEYQVKLMPDGKDETILPCFKIASQKTEIPQIVYDSMDEISKYLKKENFENENVKWFLIKMLRTYRNSLHTEFFLCKYF